MLLQCFWIPDFYLSATHMSWLSFQGCMCFVFPSFFQKVFHSQPHTQKNITQMKLSIALRSYLLKTKALFQPSFFRDYVKFPGSRWIWVINLFLWSQSSCYHHHRCHLPKWRRFHPVESLQKHETMLWPQRWEVNPGKNGNKGNGAGFWMGNSLSRWIEITFYQPRFRWN